MRCVSSIRRYSNMETGSGVYGEACPKAPAASDSCSIKLIMNSQHTTEVYSICQYIETKQRCIRRLEANIKRLERKRQKLEGLDRSCKAGYSYQHTIQRARYKKSQQTEMPRKSKSYCCRLSYCRRAFRSGVVCMATKPRDRDLSNLAGTFAG